MHVIPDALLLYGTLAFALPSAEAYNGQYFFPVLLRGLSWRAVAPGGEEGATASKKNAAKKPQTRRGSQLISMVEVSRPVSIQEIPCQDSFTRDDFMVALSRVSQPQPSEKES